LAPKKAVQKKGKQPKRDEFALKSAKSDRYLSPLEITAINQMRYSSASYNGGGRFADIWAKTY